MRCKPSKMVLMGFCISLAHVRAMKFFAAVWVFRDASILMLSRQAYTDNVTSISLFTWLEIITYTQKFIRETSILVHLLFVVFFGTGG